MRRSDGARGYDVLGGLSAFGEVNWFPWGLHVPAASAGWPSAAVIAVAHSLLHHLLELRVTGWQVATLRAYLNLSEMDPLSISLLGFTKILRASRFDNSTAKNLYGNCSKWSIILYLIWYFSTLYRSFLRIAILYSCESQGRRCANDTAHVHRSTRPFDAVGLNRRMIALVLRR